MNQLDFRAIAPNEKAFAPNEEAWHNNDWETPDGGIKGSRPIAQMFASLLYESDTCVVDAGAGRGNITQFLPAGSIAIESNPRRVKDGKIKAPQATWREGDFLGFYAIMDRKISCIVSNPPFENAIAFMEQAKRMLDATDSIPRMLFLLPTQFFQTQSNAKAFRRLDLTIHCEYKIVGRVGYIKDGIVENRRQVYDSIFDIRSHKSPINSVKLIHESY